MVPSSALELGAVVGTNWASSEPCLPVVRGPRQAGVRCSVLIQDFSPCRLFHSGVPAAAAAQPPCPGGEEAGAHGHPPPPAGTALHLFLLRLTLYFSLFLVPLLVCLGMLVSLSLCVSVPWCPRGVSFGVSHLTIWISPRSPPSP